MKHPAVARRGAPFLLQRCPLRKGKAASAAGWPLHRGRWFSPRLSLRLVWRYVPYQ